MGNQTHFIHEEDNRRTLGFRVMENGNDRVSVEVAAAYCSPRDNFDHRVARTIVRNRLNDLEEGKARVSHVQELSVAMPYPQSYREWRELEQSVRNLFELRDAGPAARPNTLS